VLPLGELGASFGSLPASAVLSAYAGSALAVREILDRAGGPRLMGLFGDLGAGTDFDRAFDSWVQIPFDQFQQQWLTAVRESRAGR